MSGGGSSGGSSGGGGGGSGVVDYPAYMKTFHGRLLDNNGADVLTQSVTDIINAALSDNPFTGESAFNPDTALAANDSAIAVFSALLTGINEIVNWGSIYDGVVAKIDGVEEAEITADIAAFAALQDDQINTVILPRFQAGMRDINAVVSSAFVLGESNIEGFRNRDVAQHSSKLRIASISNRSNLYVHAADQVLRFTMQKYAWKETLVKTVIETNRIKIVAKKEEADINLDIDENDALWDIKLFQHGSNALAGIGGGTVAASGKQKSQAASTIGGAISGGVAGYMIAGASGGAIGGPAGIIGGAVLGAAMSFL